MADAPATVIDLVKAVTGFNPNDGNAISKAILPSLSAIFGRNDESVGIDSYLEAAKAVSETPTGQRVIDAVVALNQAKISAKFEDIMKALAVPANFMTFARMSYMPDATSSGILPWPGVHPEALKKIMRENVAPNLIINTRLDDVLRYSELSTHDWRPGWRIEVFQGKNRPTDEDKRDIRKAEEFLHSSCADLSYADSLKRDERNLTDFKLFSIAIAYDSLTFDGIAINTERDSYGRVKAYSPIPAGNMRLVGPQGYEKNPDAYIVAVDEGGVIKQSFNRNELIWYVRNIRTDPEHAVTMTRCYGSPEIDMTLRLIQGVQNVIDYNVDIFNRNGTPNGMMFVSGNGWTQRQIDVLTRMWHNLKRGITKAHAIPVMAAPQDSKVEIIDFSKIKGTEGLYQDLLNLLIGMFCTMYRFPVHRFGYRASGHGPDTRRDTTTQAPLVDDDDPGLVALLIHMQNVINNNLIWPRWPNLQFVYTGKNPKEAAREYEFKRNALTWAEARREVDLPELDTLVTDSAHKELAALMGLAPIDANLSGIFQSLAATYLKGELGLESGGKDGAEPKGKMQSKKDPAVSELGHSHMAGVRRDSKREAESANAKRALTAD